MVEEPSLHFYPIDYKADQLGFYSQAHSHNHYELFFFNKGNAQHIIDFESYPISDSSFFLISYNQVHYISAPPFSHNVGFVVYFNPAYFDFLEKDLQCLFGAFGQRPAYYMETESKGFISALFEQIQAEVNKDLPEAKSLILQYLKIILTYVYRLRQEYQENSGQSTFTSVSCNL